MESEEEFLVHPKNTWKRSTIRRDIQVSYIYVYMYNNARQKYVRPIIPPKFIFIKFHFFFFLLKEALWTIHVVYIISCHLFSAVIWEAQRVLFHFVYSFHYFFFFNFWSMLYHKAVRLQSANLQPLSKKKGDREEI